MKAEMIVDNHTATMMQKAISKGLSDCGLGETLFDKEVKFEDGKRMAIQVIASEDSDGFAWTQGVLFDSNGCEIDCTEVMEDFVGEFQIGQYATVVKTA
jgi:hypothetical protein